MVKHQRKNRIERSDQMVAIFEMLKTSSWYEKKITRLLKPYGISHEQYNVLRILEFNYPRSFSLKEIQSRLLNQTANTTRLVNKLRTNGLLICDVQEKDKRSLRIVISKEGLDALHQVEMVLGEFVSKIIKSLDAMDAKAVTKIMRDIRRTDI